MRLGNDIISKILKFTHKDNKIFTLDELIEYVGRADEKAIAFIEYVLNNNTLAYHLSNENKWITRCGYFQNKEIAARITEAELKNGVFVMGSRFAPFSLTFDNKDLFRLKYKNRYIGKKKAEFSINEIESLYFLHKVEASVALLFDNAAEKNMEISDITPLIDDYKNNNKGMFSVTYEAFDFSRIYRELDIKAGDYLVFKAENYVDKVFSVIKKSVQEKKEEKKWLNCLENSIKSAVDILKMPKGEDLVLSLAFFLGDNNLFTENPSAIEAYFNEKSIFTMRTYGIDQRLWFRDKEMPEPEEWNLQIPYPLDDESEFFYKIKTPLTKNILQSYIKIFLHDNYMNAGKPKYKEKCVKDIHHIFIPEFTDDFKKNRKESKQIILNIYNSLLSNYNPFEHDKIIMFYKVLGKLYADVIWLINLIRKQGYKPHDFKIQEALILNQIASKASDMLDNLDNVAFIGNGMGLVALYDQFENLEMIFNDIKSEIFN